MSIRQTFNSLGHGRQASQLRDQLQGLLPDSLKPAVTAVANQAEDGRGKLLDYVQLASEYWEPVTALLQRFSHRAPEVLEEAAPAVRRRFGVHPHAAVGIVIGLGLAAYGVARAVQDFNRDA